MNKIREELKKKVNNEEVVMKNKVDSDKWRLNYHLMPPTGWLNDPNGLCYFKGEYHVFYQYSPLDPEGSDKFWGHYTSKDLINWKKEEVALLSDEAFDKDGVYSGSALIDDDTIHFYYTGNVKHEGNYDYIYEGRGHNTVLVTSKDGRNFTEKELLLENKDYPSNMSCHIRDPKVWKEEDNYYMVLGARDKNDIGQVLLYESKDKRNWIIKNLIKSEEKFGFMWECPDFFELDGKQVLLICPQGVETNGIDFQNIYQCGYFLVDGDIKTENYKLSGFKELDRGFDIYAPQTFLDSKGRRILIGWMGIPDADYINPTIEKWWQHALTIPRELKVIGNKIYQLPIEELKVLRKSSKKLNLKETIIANYSYELEIDVHNEVESLEIKLREDVKLTYGNDGLFKLSMGKSGYGRDERSVIISNLKNLRIFNDNSSLEIFLNDGEESFTTRVYDGLKNNEIYIDCKNTKATINIYEMDKFSYK